MAKKDIDKYIEGIEVYINQAKASPLSQNKITLQKDELLEMIKELKLKLPMEIERCKKIMRNKENILSEARTRAEAILAESVNEANRLVDTNQITELANIRANEILEMARAQAQQLVDQASEEANEIRLGAMYYTKDKLTEMRDIFSRIHAMEKENYRNLIESLENDTYIVETNLSEMEANINLLTAGSGMMYERTEEIDSAFSTNEPIAPKLAPKRKVDDFDDDFDDEDDEDDDIDVYGDNSDDEDDDDFDDFLDD
ncbi:MAG: hypothetical protein E7263_07230 [Lachnospiraceae bacterium]|nr:hypothetical protein [Lachnospiraceae bacterium]